MNLSLDKAHNQHEEVQEFVKQLTSFNISFDLVVTDTWKLIPMKKMSVKKQYEVHSVFFQS